MAAATARCVRVLCVGGEGRQPARQPLQRSEVQAVCLHTHRVRESERGEGGGGGGCSCASQRGGCARTRLSNT